MQTPYSTKYLEVLTDDKNIYQVMQYIPYDTLQKYITNENHNVLNNNLTL